MLRALRLENFRSFADSGRIELSDLNVFIGPNSAGKSNIMTVIELALRSEISARAPLPLDEMPSFASFVSVLRRNGGTRAHRPSELSITFEMGEDDPAEDKGVRSRRYVLREALSGAPFVHRAELGPTTNPDEYIVEASDTSGKEYRVKAPAKDVTSDVSFFNGELALTKPKRPGRRSSTSMHVSALRSQTRETIVVRPYRPVPRSVYVLDDPMMGADDRRLITDLLRVWSGEDGKQARERIISGLRTMVLAADIDVRAVARGQGTQMAEVLVTPQDKGRAVTLADVGYGVSQVLPFLSQDAQSVNKNLIVYQPEAHLHPLSQSRLADVFVASVKRGNRAYVETHSEHLVLRLQALIAGGEIAPDRVRVFCVEHDGKKSNLSPMLFDARGVPLTPWPRGFLDTGLELARDLAQRRRGAPPGQKPDA
jgi:hypothetical protein